MVERVSHQNHHHMKERSLMCCSTARSHIGGSEKRNITYHDNKCNTKQNNTLLRHTAIHTSTYIHLNIVRWAMQTILCIYTYAHTYIPSYKSYFQKKDKTLLKQYSYCASAAATGPASEGCAVTGSVEAAAPVSTVDSSLLPDPVT